MPAMWMLRLMPYALCLMPDTALMHAWQVAGDVDAATHYLQEMVRLNEALSY